MKTIGIQYAKTFLPEILKAAHSIVETVKQKNSQIDYGSTLKQQFFELMAKIMFGENFLRDVDTVTHYSQEGK